MKVSVIILTKDRASMLRRALASIRSQRYEDFEVVVVNDGSVDATHDVIHDFQSLFKPVHVITHDKPRGITTSRQEAIEAAQGEYVVFLDDDDEWVDKDKLTKQARFLEEHADYVGVGGGIALISNFSPSGRSPEGGQFLSLREIPRRGTISKFRPREDKEIRKWMLFRNPFFTSTVMLRKRAVVEVGGFVKDEKDFAEDYDLWLRLGKVGKLYNFQEVFTDYTQPSYTKKRYKEFLSKQLTLIERYKKDYPGFWLAWVILKLRLLF